MQTEDHDPRGNQFHSGSRARRRRQSDERNEDKDDTHRRGNAVKEEAFLAPKTQKKGLAQRGIWGISGVRKIRTRQSQSDVQDHADILDLRPSKILENRNEVQEFIVVCVREPAADGYRVLRVEDIGSWGVVDDDGFPKVTANLRKILDEC